MTSQFDLCFLLLVAIFNIKRKRRVLHILIMCLPVFSLTGSDIVESNPGKFRLGETELKERKDFVERTRKSVQVKLPFDFFHLVLLTPGRVLCFVCFPIYMRTFILELLLAETHTAWKAVGVIWQPERFRQKQTNWRSDKVSRCS